MIGIYGEMPVAQYERLSAEEPVMPFARERTLSASPMRDICGR
jgi:hypothetical protein